MRYIVLEDETITDKFHLPLNRIQYIVDGPEGIKNGDLGGLILKSQANNILPQEGNGWILYNGFGIGGTLNNGILKHGTLYNGIWNESPYNTIINIPPHPYITINNCGINMIQIGCRNMSIDEWIWYRNNPHNIYNRVIPEEIKLQLLLSFNDCIQQQRDLGYY